MTIVFDDDVWWDGSYMTGWANRGSERIRCQASRVTIAELASFTHATSLQIGARKSRAFQLMKDAFIKKMERDEFDGGEIKSVTLTMRDLGPLNAAKTGLLLTRR
jgi:hypothetical protein